MQIKRILFPTDFSERANMALDHALVLAHRFDAELIMLYVETPHGADPHNPKKAFPDLEPLFSFLREHVTNRMDDPELPVLSGKISIREEIRRGISAAEEILAFADEDKVDLIVMSTHGHSGIARFLLGSTTEKVMHSSKIPVLTIGHGEDRLIKNQGNYERILFPIDFSDASKSAVLSGLEIVKRFKAEVVFLHVLEPILTSQAFFSGTLTQAQVDPELEQRSELALHNFLGDDLPSDYAFYLKSGLAHQEIISLSNEKFCDLVIIADKGWNVLDRWLLGSTTEKLIRKSPVPVLVVK